MKTHWIIKHLEEIAGAALCLFHNLFGWNLDVLQFDMIDVLIKVLSDIPGFFAAGFFGGLGGFVIRMILKFSAITYRKISNKNESNP